MVMKYVVLTIVPRLKRRPRPGEDFKTGIREVGCSKCVIKLDSKYEEKLHPCWQHKNDHILWAENEEYEDTDAFILEGTTQSVVGVPYLENTPRTEEPVEVS